MTQEISSLMDGEAETHEAERAIRSCCATPEAARKWQEYHLIGEVMRGGVPHPTATAERVHEALRLEPTIVARPRRVLETRAARFAMAAAASVATVGVVGWIGSQGGAGPSPGAVVAKNPGAIQPVSNTRGVAGSTIDQEYLTAHRRLPTPESYRPVTNRAAPAAAR